jgi:precorrin-6A/cobalt-precorrin-6A reductase
MQRVKLLILGGSGEAANLSRALAGDPRFDATVSLAGVTEEPVSLPVPVRRGGFGGAEGLARYLSDNCIGLVIDATHPFAVGMKANAVEACDLARVRLLALRRPPWCSSDGDCWIMVDDLDAAADAIGNEPRRVFLTTGRKELAPFARAPQHIYLVRSVDTPEPESLPPNAELIVARGPFAEDQERQLLETHRIEVVVTKNSGGTGSVAKLEAARKLRLPIIMVRRPKLPDAEGVESVATVDEALAWLDAHHAGTSARLGV